MVAILSRPQCVNETAIRFGVRWSRGNLRWRHSIKVTDHENSGPVSIGFSETTFWHSRFECRSRQVCVFEGKHSASTDGISFAGTWVSCQEPATVTGSGVDLHTGYSPSQPVLSGKDPLPCQAIEAISTGLGTNPGGVSGCLSIGTATSEISWEVISADGSWRQSKMLTHELRESTTELQHMRSEPCQHHGLTTVKWCYLIFCQLRFGSRQESSRIPIYETWLVSLMGCLLWVQWWSCRGSRTTSPTSITYTICMWPLLRCS